MLLFVKTNKLKIKVIVVVILFIKRGIAR
jgi:hypothetical protein